MRNSRIMREESLAPFFTENLKKKRKIEDARLTEREDGSKTIEIKFCENVAETEKQVMIVAIGNNLLDLCESMSKKQDENNAPFLEFMDGAQIREWTK